MPKKSIFCPYGHTNCSVIAQLEKVRAQCERLLQQVETDGLTGLYNYRHFMKTLDAEMERTRRMGLPTSLIMIDLDHFKVVNDRYGHEIGNLVLQHVAALWQENTRKIDTVCRYGGEEFAIILPNTMLMRAVNTAERLRKILEESFIEVDGQKVRVTASFGVDVFTHSEQMSPRQFIERTDGYLIQAKGLGRNKVCYSGRRGKKGPTEITKEERADLLFHVKE